MTTTATEKLTLTDDIKEVLSLDLAKNPQFYAYTVWLSTTLNIIVYEGHRSTVAAYEHRKELTNGGVSEDDTLVVKFTQLDEIEL